MNSIVDTGHGATLTLSTSALVLNWTGIDAGEETIPEVNRTHLGTTDYQEYMPGDLKEPGEITIPFQWDNEAELNIGVVENITITWPLADGQVDQATQAGTGFIKRLKRPNFQTNQIQDGEITIKWDGLTGPIYTPGAD